MWDERLLALRPTNAMHQLGAGSRAPLFNGRHLIDALRGSPAVLWLPVLPHPAAAAGVLRAAAHRRAAVGLVLAPSTFDEVERVRRSAPAALLCAAADAAEGLPHPPPFCLHLQLPPLDAATGPRLDAAAALVVACLEAGFTSFGVDLGPCPAEGQAAAAAAVLGPVLDLELAVAVRPAVGPRVTAAVVAAVVERLRAVGLSPDLVLLLGAGEALREATELAPLVAPAAVGLVGAVPAFPAGALAQATIRALVAEPSLLTLAPSPGAVDAGRLEAMAYVEAHERLGRLGLSGSAERVVRALREIL